jgi:glutaredoxin
MKGMKRSALTIAFLLPSLLGAVPACALEPLIYFFWMEGCPHCTAAKTFLEKLEARFPQVEIKTYEVSGEEANEKLYRDILALYGIKRQIFPVTFIGDLDPVVGYYTDSTTGAEMEEKVRYCLKNRCGDPIGSFLRKTGRRETVFGAAGGNPPDELTGALKLPFVKDLNPSQVALPLFTAVIALLDSANPCAFFVLTFLMSLLTRLSSSKKMLAIGGTFVFFSAVMYFVFMSAWFNLFFFTRTLRIVTVAAGAAAVCMALVNIKDFLFFKRGFSLGIPDGKRQVLVARMRTLAVSGRIPAIIAGTALLATGANFYEMLCTAGFPMVYTKVLTLKKMEMAAYYFYLMMYNVIYVVPLMVIVVVFAVALGSRKMTERQGRVLKLASGSMMISLGSVLIVNPSILSRVSYSVLMVAGAIALSLLVAFLAKARLGIDRRA